MSAGSLLLPGILLGASVAAGLWQALQIMGKIAPRMEATKRGWLIPVVFLGMLAALFGAATIIGVGIVRFLQAGAPNGNDVGKLVRVGFAVGVLGYIFGLGVYLRLRRK